MATAVASRPRPLGLSPDRERERRRDRVLFQHRDANRSARDELIESKLPLARSLARRYSGGRSEREDLFQVAAVGLIKAVDRFDPSRGIAFSSFAVPTITGELRRHLRDTTWAAHVPRDAQETAQQLMRFSDELTSSLGRAPTVAELAHASGRTREQVIEGLEACHALDASSLDAPAPGGDEAAGERYERLGSVDSGMERVEQRATAQWVIDRLPERERDLLRMRFELGMTQSQIAEQIGFSQMHVSRLIRRALDRAAVLASG